MLVLTTVLYSVSLACQFLAVCICLLLVARTTTAYKWSWVALAAGMVLMLGRRINPILEMQFTGQYSLIDAMLSIPISALMLTGIFGINRLLRKVQRENDFLVTLSKHDALTNALSRSEILFRVKEEIARSNRNKHPFALLELDIDHFKVVNDTFGHTLGDDVLKKMVQLAKEQLRSIDAIGRIGGEEFLILLPETNQEQARIIAERVRIHIQASEICTCQSQDIKITVSGGIAVYDPARHDADTCISENELICEADAAMYLAKNQGRNRIKTWNESLDCHVQA